ncbi:UDP-N-acetylmuramate dehydrogenase [Prolixibacteraceae bacterium Z1-6]|uniref:UDP-N-acetylenolpyruvoylglucosamine reductase n=1 Tax=Draconibacterium aestuarii TaxID=2998507 RepID=A0A9X3F6T9_9BACT|nr:UDP-N-acetylmuramate dehydrogenase [Prolixibacteraceae bacterium Z1-6]
MIRFFENHSLKQHNTFGIDAKAKYFFEFTEPEDLELFLNSNETWKEEKLIVLGEGSNILFLDDFDGLVIHPKVPGITSVYEDRQNEWYEVGSGEVWDEFVQHAVTCQLGGAENLSLIPGTVGAAPVQNIGAYGQEVCSLIEKVKGFDLEKGTMVEYAGNACGFEYRSSIFKSYLKNKFIITSVIFKLDKFPEFNLKYGQLEEKVKEKGEVNLHTVRQSVIEIRSSKLPDVKDLGNAGSFFKNPVVTAEAAEKLQLKFDGIPVYPGAEGKMKLAAGWLIEQAGWKGKREGDAGVHDQQALVLVNHGNASGRDIYNFSEKIKQSVFEKFGVELDREVNCI